jgi:hypothetical protein
MPGLGELNEIFKKAPRPMVKPAVQPESDAPIKPPRPMVKPMEPIKEPMEPDPDMHCEEVKTNANDQVVRQSISIDDIIGGGVRKESSGATATNCKSK